MGGIDARIELVPYLALVVVLAHEEDSTNSCEDETHE